MATNIPFPEAQTLLDILTPEQKVALQRLNIQAIITHLSNPPQDELSVQNWPKIMRANLPGVVKAVEDQILTPEWLEKANTLIAANQAALLPE
jgi:hypothetical protein